MNYYSENALQDLTQRGFIGPLQAPVSDFKDIRRQLINHSASKMPNPVYGTLSLRDLHLINLPILKLVLWNPLIRLLQNAIGDGTSFFGVRKFFSNGLAAIGFIGIKSGASFAVKSSVQINPQYGIA